MESPLPLLWQLPPTPGLIEVAVVLTGRSFPPTITVSNSAEVVVVVEVETIEGNRAKAVAQTTTTGMGMGIAVIHIIIIITINSNNIIVIIIMSMFIPTYLPRPITITGVEEVVVVVTGMLAAAQLIGLQ